MAIPHFVFSIQNFMYMQTETQTNQAQITFSTKDSGNKTLAA